MRPVHCKFISSVLSGCLVTLSGAAAAAEQPAQPGGRASVQELGEVIVTARKREESILNVPVIETAVTEQQLSRAQTVNLTDLPKIVPGLTMGHQLLAIGTQLTIRGVGTSASDAGPDSSVALVVDGLGMGNGLALASGMFDLQQIEVLRGPQALFYGKASPGGVIAMRTADPTDRTEVIARAGYEQVAKLYRGEVIVSGALGSTFKGRLAGMYQSGDGYFNNIATVPAPFAFGGMTPIYSREPRPRNSQVRGTLLWDPTDRLSARLKVNLVHDRAVDGETAQLASCPEGPGFAPFGIPFIGQDDCKLDRNLRIVYMDPAAFPGINNSGVPYIDTLQRYGTLELNYRPAANLNLSSTTGLYALKSDSLVNAIHTTNAGTSIACENFFHRRDATEELRLNSDYSGAHNFTVGAYYEDGNFEQSGLCLGNRAIGFPAAVVNGQVHVDIKTSSLFGQWRWDVAPRTELALGARWTDERRTETVLNRLANPTAPNSPINVAVPEIKANNVAPEATLTYRPTDDFTWFAAVKQGFKSGSFAVATPPAPGADNSFGDEKVKGGETGIKSRWLERRLLLNAALYWYDYRGLQVGSIEPAANGVPFIHVVNAGAARTYGMDADLAYRPESAAGLELNAALSWNHAQYQSLTNVPCWGGQMISEGCTRVLDPTTGRFTAQDLSGTPMIRAPEWVYNAGFTYEVGVGQNLKLVMTNNNVYTSKYVSFLAVGRPNEDNLQNGFFKSDLGFTLQDNADRWEAALIGKNVTDKITAGRCDPSNFAAGIIGGEITGGTTRGPAQIDQVGCNTDPGREVWLRLTWRPYAGR